ncbi:MAG: VCBS repeat-containing protein [Verrucomicrobia bacterium]|nr:VCBS repeat-containing protein [Verrucomicrobiota bacterium]
MKHANYTMTWASLALSCLAGGPAGDTGANHTVIKIGFSLGNQAEDSAGGLIVADADNDQRMDFLVTAPGQLVVLANDGRTLWRKAVDIVVGGQSESQGLPGHHGPGVAAADVDGDGRTEVVFLTKDSVLHIVEGATGREKAAAKPRVPPGAARWELAMIATFRGRQTGTSCCRPPTRRGIGWDSSSRPTGLRICWPARNPSGRRTGLSPALTTGRAWPTSTGMAWTRFSAPPSSPRRGGFWWRRRRSRVTWTVCL